MIEEYAVVRLRLAEQGIPIPVGTTGTILVVHASNPPAYEVEFMDEDGKSLGVHSVYEANLEVTWRPTLGSAD
jgi:hypothetical protein